MKKSGYFMGLLFGILLMTSFISVKIAYAQGNAVEPISNGISLTMKRNEILQKFGDAKPNWDRGSLEYPGFFVVCGEDSIWYLIITGANINLNSGIGIGSTRAKVAS